jgi:hypothetical protein
MKEVNRFCGSYVAITATQVLLTFAETKVSRTEGYPEIG